MIEFTLSHLRAAFDAGRYSMENLPQRTADSVFDEFLVSLDPPKKQAETVPETAGPVERPAPADSASTAVEG